MPIDGHCHVEQEAWVGEPWWQGVARLGSRILGVPAEMIRENVIPAYFDEDGSSQLGAMEQAGVDVAVLFAHDWTLEQHLGEPTVGWREQNAWYRSFAETAEKRIRWGFGADPRHEGALEAFEEAAREGAVCVKLHPSAGFMLNDRDLVYPFLEVATGASIPVVFHTGPSVAPLYSRWSDPSLLDDVAADFPAVRMQAAHTGNALWREVLAVATNKPNVYCDLSNWQLRFVRNQDRFYADLREVLETVGASRVMWGTDGPYFRALLPDDAWVKAIGEAPAEALTDEEREAILEGTAREFYSIG